MTWLINDQKYENKKKNMTARLTKTTELKARDLGQAHIEYINIISRLSLDILPEYQNASDIII